MKTASFRLFRGALLFGVFTLLIAAGASRRAAAADTNTIVSLKNVRTAAGPTVEITLTSSRPFEVRDDVLLLEIGTSNFHISRSPADGSLNTEIYVLSAAQFAALKTGDPVCIYYSSSTPTGADSWSFGKFDKSLLK